MQKGRYFVGVQESVKMMPTPVQANRRFDAAEISLIKSWSEARLMPTFARLFAESMHGELTNASRSIRGGCGRRSSQA